MSWCGRSAAAVLAAVGFWFGCQLLPTPLGPDAEARVAAPNLPPATSVAGLGDSLLVREDSWFRLVCDTGELGTCLNAGVRGDTTPGMLDRLGSQVLPEQPRALVLMGGTNDVPKDVPTQDIVDELDAIVLAARGAGLRVVLCTVPPRDRYAEQVLELNEAIRLYAHEQRVSLLDMYDVVGTPEGVFADGLSDDGIHPNAEGNRLMAASADRELPGLLGLSELG